MVNIIREHYPCAASGCGPGFAGPFPGSVGGTEEAVGGWREGFDGEADLAAVVPQEKADAGL